MILLPLQLFASDNSINVWLLDITPGNAVYSAFGHQALRLQCPEQNLDFCFSYEMTIDMADDVVDFFLGNGRAGFLAMTTEDFLQQYIAEGRGVTQYQLNLSLQEKKRLWEFLDNEIVKDAPYQYDYVHNMCSTMALYAVERSMDNGSVLSFGKKPEAMYGTSRHAFLYGSRNALWARFFWQTIMGSSSDNVPDIRCNMCPELMLEALQNAIIVTGASQRPVIAGNEEILFPATGSNRTRFIPVICFSIVLLLSCVVTYMQLFRRLHILPLIFDLILFTSVFLLGCFLVFLVTASHLVATEWNWYIIPFFPLLPFSFFTKGAIRVRLFRLYMIVLLLTIISAPFIPQFDLPHMLIVGAIAIRVLPRTKWLNRI